MFIVFSLFYISWLVVDDLYLLPIDSRSGHVDIIVVGKL